MKKKGDGRICGGVYLIGNLQLLQLYNSCYGKLTNKVFTKFLHKVPIRAFKLPH